jgi:DNA-binding NtrC family response regulator
LIDHHLQDIKGSSLIRDIRNIDSKLSLLGFSGDDSVEAHNESLDSGALMFVSKETDNQKLLGIIHRICREFERRTKPLQAGEHSANRKLIESLGLVGVSDQMAEVAKLILKVSSSDHTVLIRGENGTGKEKVAQAIHENSRRSRGTFIGINCAAIPENLIESELFGHEKGAFTGAVAAKVGKFQMANNGTIFLDEIGEIPNHLQVKLLRVLQEKEITPVGSNTTKKINARILAATNANLEKKIEAGTFREDLFYRLNVIPIHIAPLRERPADIQGLIAHFLELANKETGVEKKILEVCVRELQKKPWPGNVRDLGHTVRRLHLWAEDLVIDEATLDDCLLESPEVEIKEQLMDYDTLKHQQVADEKRLILRALSQSINITEAANRLGIGRTTLRDRIKALKLKPNNQIKGEV